MKYKIFILLIFFITSCSKEEFSANRNDESESVGQVGSYEHRECSNFTLVKPKVDFLYIWDNSLSATYSLDQMEVGFGRTLKLISSRFDYRIMIAPLMGTGLNDVKVIASNPKNLNQSNLSRIIPLDQGPDILFSYPRQSGKEDGMSRALELLKNGVTQNIFRTHAYTNIVIISNTDVKIGTSGGYVNPSATANHPHNMYNDFVNYDQQTLNSDMLRFFSVVPHSECGHQFDDAHQYRKLSKLLFLYSEQKGTSSRNEAGLNQEHFDSVDLCQGNYNHIFDGINGSIQNKLILHKYDYWPVVNDPNLVIDPKKIIAIKSTGEKFYRNATNGFEYIGIKTKNIRYYPTRGEPFTGHLIKLNGNAKVVFPDCMRVVSSAPLEYYGYLRLHSKPLVDSIKVEINGADVPMSQTNGWYPLGNNPPDSMFMNSFNIRIMGPKYSDPYKAHFQKVLQTGYFIKLNGNAIITNGDSIRVHYLPKSN